MGAKGADIAAAWLRDPRDARVLARRAERQIHQTMGRLGWLIYRINHPVLRAMFMNPNNRLRMRDGLVSVLAGNLDGGARFALPFLAFKASFRLLCVLAWCGWRRQEAMAPAE